MRDSVTQTVNHASDFNRIYQLDQAARQIDDMINYQRTLTRSLERVQKLIVALTSQKPM